MKIASLISGCNDYTHLLSIKEHVMREEKPIPTTRKSEVKFLKSLTPLVAAFLVLSPICSIPVSSAQTVDIQRGTTLFRQACIGCHDAGGNIIQPGFGKECMPRGQCTFGARLEDEDIKTLAEFVKLQADQGWPSIETKEE
ncbi:hypothetical protein AAZX31_20G019000 [Glycine max]|uniref:cytochrome c6, chloroplastic-like isoform X3 n=1 Tax=Glycine soja TaxID=3848 RepID=UPI00103C4F1A|nr:cytochrome c6, chloroplastic-like isoform X3 [Glycine soja]KAG4906351.1 hypothetical protein JHK86_054835 [Glycine max]KAG5073628.1 hypothetical protein JHK84_054859 [Glycine max]KAH1034154.1 hypothetical protein GYH30_054523 [Glycine max]KAH1188842.1 Cytochrome c6, chloroplastic [Glycine max]